MTDTDDETLALEAEETLDAATAGDVRSRIRRRDEPSRELPVTLSGEADTSFLRDASGRYRVLGEIARGGVGIVFKGRDENLGREVAIKMLRSSYRENPAMIQRFVEEAQIGGQLQHPGILPVHDLGVDADRRLFFSMKLIRGRTLAALLADRAGPSEGRQRFLGIFEQVCQTLAYAHAKGVVHRDLKPANVMVGAFGEVQVVDWGLGKVLPRTEEAERPAGASSPDRAPGEDGSTVETVRTEGSAQSVAGSVMGTPAYMPPEQARGEVELLDERSDVFSLGGILCEILTGAPPWPGDGREALAGAADGDPREIRGRLRGCGADPDLIALAERCLAPDAASRPGDAGVVAELISEYLVSLETRARQSELAAAEAAVKAAEERRARRLTAALAVSVSAAILIVAVGILWVQRERQTRRVQRTQVINDAVDGAAELLTVAHRAPAASDSEWREVAAAGSHLESLLEETEIAPGTRRRAELFLDQLDRAVRDREMSERLADVAIRGSTHDDPDSWTWMSEQLGAAFRDYGIDVGALTPEETVARIRASAIAEELAYGLDLWIRTDFLLKVMGAGGISIAEALQRMEMVYAADPDPLRTRLRKLTFAAAPDVEELWQITASDDYPTLPPPTLPLLVSAFSRVGYPAGWEAVCRDGWRRFPDDFRLNDTCAFSMIATGNWVEAARYSACTVALRPHTGGLWRRLAQSLEKTGDVDGAVSALRQSIAVQPDHAYTHVDLSRMLWEQGDAVGAERAARAAIELNPELEAQLVSPVASDHSVE